MKNMVILLFCIASLNLFSDAEVGISIFDVKIKFGLIKQNGKLIGEQRINKTEFDKLKFSLNNGYRNDFYVSNLKNDYLGLLKSDLFVPSVARLLTNEDIVAVKILNIVNKGREIIYNYNIAVIKNLGSGQKTPDYNLVQVRSVLNIDTNKVKNYVIEKGLIISASFDTAKFVITGLTNLKINKLEVFRDGKSIKAIELPKQPELRL